jgi:hypothetical protein
LRYVIVNGTRALEAGRPTGARGGAVLLRGPHEPSRTTSAAMGRKVSGRAAGTELAVNISVDQAPGQRSPKGRLRLTDSASKTAFDMTSFGALQVAPGWAAVTGRGRIGDEERAFTVIVEQSDPLDERHSSTVTVLGEDGFQLSRVVPKNTLRVSPAR